MKGVVFVGDRRLELVEFADPKPGPGEVVLRIMASGMCGSDLHPYRAESPPECIAGHEPSGIVEEVGVGVSAHMAQVGDRVTVHHYAGCNACDQCRSGWFQLCRAGTVRYGADANGSHSAYMLVPAVTLVKLPDRMTFTSGATIGCGTGTAWGGLKRLGDLNGMDLLVSGQGPVGLSATMIASSQGARVIAVDVQASRLELAKKFGAAEVVDASDVDVAVAVRELTCGVGAPRVLETSGSSGASEAALKCLSTWGRACFLGLGGGSFEVDVSKLLTTQATLMTSWTLSIAELQRCVDFVGRRCLPVDDLFTSRWRLDDAEAAYAHFDQQSAGKGVFIFD
ncbi:iditol 2-dehydrogenase [Rhodococcus sp. 06-156-3C]|nr:iditol 2-dehydrogenase [Rhodococcus sp. 06-156-4C]OZD15493.1 iditol 2-dehydrogenase [Rhodococcus sp. 06-156-4a]OZD23659.1 iditol 2-dehydrogenase [Rhodococcus sp. 06-156-3C]OZD27269.1 iditol 2-dehydrogenase [Rhodococcus sp. 06-156-3b]OZD31335.1 iditol 2-dehydrogenase [Rhodococcus sp. 06-156-3]OZF65614.1 iditol 2-dehydrogenase [Rhodococcus sp. 06-156-4]